MKEQRLYAFVPYQLTGIQKGIQVAHAICEYQLTYGDTPEYKRWVERDKTIIVLDGGTTNDIYDNKGTLQEHLFQLEDIGVHSEAFWEEDLNNAMTALVFIADESVYNHEDYPFISKFLNDKIDNIEWLKTFKDGDVFLEDVEKKYPELYSEWLKLLSDDFSEAERNAKLKYYLSNKRLASN